MALSVDTGSFFFLATGETEQTVVILHVQPHSNIHLSLWLSKCVGGNGPLSIIHDEEVLLVCHYQEVIACFYLCCLLLFWIPLTQNPTRKHGVLTDGDGCECLRVCRDLCACKSRHTHVELNKESKGRKKGSQRIKYPCQFQAKSCGGIEIRSCCLLIMLLDFQITKYNHN